jgi:sec-independent protein translocase protein TatA
MFPGVSTSELFVIFLVVLLLFGSKRLPELARRIGKSMRDFKKAADDVKKEIDIHDEL